MSSRVTRDHHSLTRNLKLNGKYISNDGGDEGLRVDDAGRASSSSHFTVGGSLKITTVSQESTTDYDKFLVLDGTDVKYVTGDTLLPDILTAGTNCTLSGATLNIDDAFVKNNANDEMTGTLTLNVTGTAKAISETLVLTNNANASDMDGTGTAIKFNQWYYDASSPAIADAGKIAVAAQADWGSNSISRDSYMAFETIRDGTLIETMRIEGGAQYVGINTSDPQAPLHVKRGLSAPQFMVSWDNNNLFSTRVYDDGKTTIETEGSGTTDSDLTLDIDGDIDLQAAGGDITFKGASDAALATINSDGLTLNNIGTDAAGDNYLVEVSGLVKKRTPAETLADIGAIPTANLLDQDDLGDDDASKPASQQSIKAYVDAVNANLGVALAGRLNNNVDDTFEGTLTIDKDTNFNTTNTSQGLYIDLDHEGAMNNGETGTFRALKIAVATNNASHQTYSTTDSYGIDIGLAANTDGVENKNTGINIDCSGGDASHTYGIKSSVTDGGIDIALYSSADSGDYCTIATTTHGATTITTVDDDAAAADLTLNIDGDINLTAAADVNIPANIGLTFGDDGEKIEGTGTDLVIASSRYVTINTVNAQFFNSEVGIFHFRDNNDANDAFKITVAGGTGETTLETISDAADGHLNFTVDGNANFDVAGIFEFDGCGVGFDLVTPTYDATDTDVDFQTGNKQFVTFGGNITDLNLIFPKTSGNFTLLLKQDGNGGRTVTNYKVWDRSNSVAASGSSTVKFAGGSNPTLTTDANHVDIISFFYDSDNEIAYGVASLDFQF